MRKILFPKFEYSGKIKSVPFWVAFSLFFISTNVIWQFIIDKLLKIIGLAGIVPYIPLRVDFIILTFISAFLGVQALNLFRKKEIEVSKRSLQIAIIVELGIICSEVFFVIRKIESYPFVLENRMFFIVMTTINILLLLLIKLKVTYNFKIRQLLKA